MKSNITVVAGMMSVVSQLLKATVAEAAKSDEKLADDIAQFSDEFELRLKKVADEYDTKFGDVQKGLIVAMAVENDRRAGIVVQEDDFSQLHDSLTRGLEAIKVLA